MTGHRSAEERGSASLELVLVVPLLLLLLAFVLAAGRVELAHSRVETVAGQAARAVSLAGSVSAADAVARRTALAALSGADLSCRSEQVTVNTTGFRPGGAVTVTVACVSDLTGLALPLPGRMTVRATASSPVDRYRQVHP